MSSARTPTSPSRKPVGSPASIDDACRSANDPEVVDAYAKAAAQVELKSPTGPQLDMVTIMPMINARLMPVPDDDHPRRVRRCRRPAGITALFRRAPNPYKEYVVVPNAGHMMHLQKGHRIFQQQVIGFLSTP